MDRLSLWSGEQLLGSEKALELLASQCALAWQEEPLMVHLEGPMGVGKTTWMRHYLRALGHTGHVVSPTYTLMQTYDFQALTVLHLDWYRLSPLDVQTFVAEFEWYQPCQIWIEWASLAEGALPPADACLSLSWQEGQRCLRWL